MSWSVQLCGKAGDALLRTEAQRLFAAAANTTLPHERKAAVLAGQIVDSELEFMASLTPRPAVKIEAYGSAYRAADGQGSSSVTVKVEPLPGFVE